MKIAIPVDTNSIDTNVSTSFGRAPYFLIYNLENKESVFIDNSAAASTGGAGIKAAQIIVDEKANILLTPRLGQNAANVLELADIKIYKSKEGLVKDNINAYIDGDLSKLNEVHSGFHGQDGGK